jgi:hypothetical protein
MPNLIQSKIAWGVLRATTVVVMSVGGYFVGWGAEAKYEDLITNDTPPPEVKLEKQGRYDEAIQAVLNRRSEGLHEADAYSQVAQIYLDRAKKDLANRGKWAHQAALYHDKAAALAPGDPFILESAMDGLNKAGDYSDQGCPHYEKAVALGEAALALLQGSTVSIEGHVRSYPTQPIREGIQPRLKRIRGKVDAWCKKAS